MNQEETDIEPRLPYTLLNVNPGAQKWIYSLIAILCLLPMVSPPIALLLGILVANVTGQPLPQQISRATKILLQASVVLLGFGMNLHTAIKAGSEGLLFTIASISGTLLMGYVLGRLFKTDNKITSLISAGTAICGGSAIAAIAPIIRANEKQISIALGTVFLLNSIALLIFPAVGHFLQLSEQQFGLWAAIAIHDTSSVVGTASKYGPQALEVATTVKLLRALWIIPVSLAFAIASKQRSGKIKIPYFIGWFVVAMSLNTYLQPISNIASHLVAIGKSGLNLTLFFIGSGLTLHTFRSVGVKPLLLAVILWISISVASLSIIINLR